MPMNEYAVEIQPDFLERQAKAQPVPAIAELIWNGLDADATRIDVELADGPLGQLDRIVVTDNGNGIEYRDAPILFKNLGGSWKRNTSTTKTEQRMLHGKEGRGRFKAFALGGVVDWKVAYANKGINYRYDISVLESDIKRIRVSDEKPFDGNKGVTVVISELKRNFSSLYPEKSLQEFSEIFAIYLKHYRHVQIHINGEKVDPSTVIANSWDESLAPIIDDDGKEHAASVEIIEWRSQTKRALYLCNEDGFPLTQVDARFHVGDFQFSAYLKSTYISQLNLDNRLELAEMVPALTKAIEETRNKIKEIFRSRAAEKARIVVDDWRAKNVYPFLGDATTQIEKAERQIFDIVAVTVQEATPGFETSQQLELHLRMLRHAIERSPTELQKILDEVLKLPKRKQKELAALLDETNLSGIISATSMIADRLKFLQGLGIILFEYEMKGRLKERTQLHKIIEQNTWIFGEEYNLWASDKELTTVLKVHKSKLDQSLVIDEPVKIVNKKRGIVDLMLSRVQKRHRANDLEHLVIELKAPKVKLTAEHMTQLEDYALAVEEDPRFNRVPGLKWHFWLISDEYNSQVAARIKNGPDPLRRLIQKGDRVQIGIKTWGEIIEENNARFQFLKQELEHRADETQALSYLQTKHREFLEGVIVEGDEEDSDEEVEAVIGIDLDTSAPLS